MLRHWAHLAFGEAPLELFSHNGCHDGHSDHRTPICQLANYGDALNHPLSSLGMIPTVPYFTIVFLSEQMGMLPEKALGFVPNQFCFLSLILGSVKGPKE